LDAHARARGLTLAAAAPGLAGARADAATDAAALLARPRAVGEFVQFHRRTLVLSSVLPGLAPGTCVLPTSMGRNAHGRDEPGHPDGLLLGIQHAHQVPDLGDHAAGLRGIRQLGDAPDPVEAEPDQRLALRMMAPDRAAGLLDLDDFLALAHVGLSGTLVTLSRRPARSRRRRAGAPAGSKP